MQCIFQLLTLILSAYRFQSYYNYQLFTRLQQHYGDVSPLRSTLQPSTDDDAPYAERPLAFERKTDNNNQNNKSTQLSTSSNGDNSYPRRKRRLPLPFMNLRSTGIVGKWIKRHDNFLLPPKRGGPPIGVIHFVGGAFVGAAPHLVYNSFLEMLSEQGYYIVATPYRLEMDYLAICDSVLGKFERVAVELAQEFGGALPVIGIGHSLGAVLQTLITSLFPDTPRAVNILISFNSKAAAAAIPLFQEVVVPFSKQAVAAVENEDKAASSDNNNSTSSSSRSSKNRFMPVTRLRKLRQSAEYLFETYAQSQFSPLFIQEEIWPAIKDSQELVDQIPPLLKQFADGKVEFTPQFVDLKEVCRRMYRARRTLLIKFDNDSIDESEQILSVLREANTIMRMKRPMIEMEVTLKNLPGSHVTPLVPALNPALNNRLLTPAVSSLDEIKFVKGLAEDVLDFLASGVKASSSSSPLP